MYGLSAQLTRKLSFENSLGNEIPLEEGTSVKVLDMHSSREDPDGLIALLEHSVKGMGSYYAEEEWKSIIPLLTVL